jgi:hypothetical protein
MGRSRSQSLTKDPTLPESSSRFLKYLGLDAYQKPSLKKLTGISSNNNHIARSKSQTNSSTSSGNEPVFVNSLLPDFVGENERRRQNQLVSGTPACPLSVNPVGGAVDLVGSMSSISIPLPDAGLHPHSTSSPTSPTTFHAPHSWGRKFSLPLIPLWPSPSSSSRTLIDTPPLSPTTEGHKPSPVIFPPTPNPRRPSMRSRAVFGEPIEPLHYRPPPLPPSRMQPLLHPQFDFEARRIARSLSFDNQITTVEIPHPFAMPSNEVSAHSPATSPRLSTFLELTQYLSEDDNSSAENDSESIVEFADVLTGRRQPKTSFASPSIEPFRSENAVSFHGKGSISP